MKDWIEQELDKIKQSYITKVLNMTGAYRREIERIKEYNGRQLLELLQNADDEAERAKEQKVLIRLESNRLIIANNGEPFSKGGILSLMYSDNSPKIKRQRKIGYKGLGFRAILNWSDSIWIKSGPFSLEFSRKNAIAYLKSLLTEHPELNSEILEAATENEKYPIATLAVPKWKDSTGPDFDEYDTYVVMNFTSGDIKKDIQAQINELGLEVGLFLNNLTEIRIESSERNETIKRIPPEQGFSDKNGFYEMRLLNAAEEIIAKKEWRIFTSSGELPENLRQDETTRQFEFDLRIAVSNKMDDNVNRLFSYFKTEVKLPFPAIIHGTFELDGSRNHLNDTPVNEFLLKKLAELMIKTAKALTQSKKTVTWDSIKLLA
jgi:hypothetical protein